MSNMPTRGPSLIDPDQILRSAPPVFAFRPPVRGVTRVRQPPGDLQKVTTYGAAIMSDAKAAKPAAAFVGCLTGTGGVRSKGFAAPRP